MFEPEAGELLYGLLTIKGYTIIFYEKVVKVRKILVNIVMGWNIQGCELWDNIHKCLCNNPFII